MVSGLSGEQLVGLAQLPLWAFLCVLCRLGPILMLSPPMRGSGVPLRARALLAITISLCLTPLVMETATNMPTSLIVLVGRLALEMMLGMMLGTAALILVGALQTGATIVSNLSGMDLAQAADPTTDEQSSVFAQFFSWLAMAIYLAMGGHRQLIISGIDSFGTYAAGAVIVEESWVMHVSGLFAHSMEIGIRAGAPMAVALFLANLVSAILNRTLPSFNIMAVGFNINAFVLLTTMMLTIGSVGWVFQGEVVEWIERTTLIFRGARGG